ncbi:MAG: hypothetical protein HKL95_04810 [Phycisphaerae bacterium]|nr:hypothetical protein [Phycisphaerae bacterium]
MDVRTEQAYRERIAELELQNARLEVRIVDLTHQLAQRDATITVLQQQVAALSKQVAELLAQVARDSRAIASRFIVTVTRVAGNDRDCHGFTFIAVISSAKSKHVSATLPATTSASLGGHL